MERRMQVCATCQLSDDEEEVMAMCSKCGK